MSIFPPGRLQSSAGSRPLAAGQSQPSAATSGCYWRRGPGRRPPRRRGVRGGKRRPQFLSLPLTALRVTMAALAALRGGVRRPLLRGLLQVSRGQFRGSPPPAVQGSALPQGPGRAAWGWGWGSPAPAPTTRARGSVSPCPSVLLSHWPGQRGLGLTRRDPRLQRSEPLYRPRSFVDVL